MVAGSGGSEMRKEQKVVESREIVGDEGGMRWEYLWIETYEKQDDGTWKKIDVEVITRRVRG
jgi:hypothetical protein